MFMIIFLVKIMELLFDIIGGFIFLMEFFFFLDFVNIKGVFV